MADETKKTEENNNDNNNKKEAPASGVFVKPDPIAEKANRAAEASL